MEKKNNSRSLTICGKMTQYVGFLGIFHQWLSGNHVWPPASGFLNLTQLTIWGLFLMNVNLARFVGKTEWDFFGDFPTPWACLSEKEKMKWRTWWWEPIKGGKHFRAAAAGNELELPLSFCLMMMMRSRLSASMTWMAMTLISHAGHRPELEVYFYGET